MIHSSELDHPVSGLRRRTCPPFRWLPLLLCLCAGSLPAPAATRIWTGGHASSANWNLRDNWGGAAVPATGDTVVFPSGAARLVNTNNISGLRLREIQFLGLGGGFNLRGLSLTVTGGISLTADAANSLSLTSITLQGAQSINVAAGGGLTVNSDLVLAGDLTLGVVGDLSLRGGISGTGDVVKNGAGLLTYSGATENTYLGTTTVNEGTLAMNKFKTLSLVPLTQVSRIAVPGELNVGDGIHTALARLNFDDQISSAGTVRVVEGATLRFFDKRDALNQLVLRGGSVAIDGGVLVLDGDLVAQASPVTATIDGSILLNHTATFTVADGAAPTDLEISAAIGSNGGHGFTKAGDGVLRLSGTNTYLGPTLVSGGTIRVASDKAFGSTGNGTTVSAGSELLLETIVDTLREPLTIAGSGVGGASGAIRVGSAATIATNIVLSAPSTIHTLLGGNLLLEGVISGSGPLTKTGPGTLELGGKSPNSFSGPVLAKEGVLLLGKTLGASVPGDLTIGTTKTTAAARHTRSGNVSGAVTVNAHCTYDLDDNNESIDSLIFVGGGQVRTGTGLLTVDDDILVQGAPVAVADNAVILGRLRLGNGGTSHVRALTAPFSGSDFVQLIIGAQVSGNDPIVMDGPGLVTLAVSNIFTGPLTVENGRLNVYSGHAFGSTAGDTFIEDNGSLALLGDATFDGERLFLNSTNTSGYDFPCALVGTGTNHWTGTIFLGRTAGVQVTTNAVLDFSGAINGLGGLTKLGPGTLIYSGTRSNAYLGVTTVNAGKLLLARPGVDDFAIPGALVVGDGIGGSEADVVETIPFGRQIDDYAPVTVSSSGLLRLMGDEAIGSLEGAGRVVIAGELLTGGDNSSTTFSGRISGPGSLLSQGTGTFTLTGTNTYTGSTIAHWGTLVINGEQPSSDVTVHTSGILSGNGRVGHLTVHGTLAPGSPLGLLQAESVDMAAASHLAVEIKGPGFNTGYDSIYTTGSMDVGGAVLDVSLGWAPYTGQQFLIAQYDSLTGQFQGLPDGSQLVIDHIPLRVDYADETSHRISLTVGDLALRLDSTRLEGGNGNGRIDLDECNDLYVSIENPTAAAVEVLSAYLESADSRLVVTQSEGAYGVVPAGGVRTNRTAFQMRSSPSFLCGARARLQLVVRTLAHGAFAIPISLPSGSPGTPHVYSSLAGVAPIPDLGGLSSQLPVAEDFVVSKVRVSLHATHPSVGQLRFRLVSPSGLETWLVANEGGTANGFGTSCARRTVFDDDAPLNIAAAAAPFVGTFAPEGQLAELSGYSSAGIWTLLAEDTVAGGVGALQCWTLELAPAECASGGGGCASCLSTVIGTFDGVHPTMPHRLNDTAYETGCGNADPCPGLSGFGTAPFRYAVHSFTNTGPDACVTVALSVPCVDADAGLQLSAYLDGFEPDQLCQSLVGYAGFPAANGLRGCSFRVPAGRRFVVVVNETNDGAPFRGCNRYTLELYGLPCPEEKPRLHIADDAGPDAVRLHWSTAYPGYELRGRPSIGGPILGSFTNLNVSPVVVDGHYSVTNLHNGQGRGFFQLRKP